MNTAVSSLSCQRCFAEKGLLFIKRSVDVSSYFLQSFLRTVSKTVSRTFLKRSSQAVTNPRMPNHRRIIFQVGTERPLTVHRIRLDQTHRHKDRSIPRVECTMQGVWHRCVSTVDDGVVVVSKGPRVKWVDRLWRGWFAICVTRAGSVSRVDKVVLCIRGVWVIG